MAKKSVIQRNYKRKILIQKFAVLRKDLKYKIKKAKLQNNSQNIILLKNKLNKLPKNSSKTRYRNRCTITGRSRGYYKYFGFSRNILRELAHKTLLPGLQKSSW